jgi:hypothetical protein
MNDNSDLTNDNKEENLHFNIIGIINKIQLKKKLNNKLENDKIIYISGKMYSHTTVGNYLFQACDFYLFSPEDNKLYHSIMNSNDCFTNTLKWTTNFFKRIRASLNSKNQSKKFYFIISEINDNNNDDIESNNQKFFELHFIVKNQDITSFRLLLEEIIENESNVFFSNKIIELNKELEDRVREKEEKYFKKEDSIKDIENNIKEKEDNFKNKKNEMITKFYLLIDEKNQKIEKLQKETKKQNKKNK